MSIRTLHGRYTFERGQFVPDDGMRQIQARLSRMKLLADSGEGIPSFYFDPIERTYWQSTEFEDYRKELKEVSRAYIEAVFPSVNCDKLLDVAR